MIEARGVELRRGRRVIVRDVSLLVRRSEVLAIVGPNGAGKSTLLAALAGDLAPTAGSIWLAGQPLDALGPKERARLRAVLPQQSELRFAFSVRDVVRMGRAPFLRGGRETDRDLAVVEDALRAVDVAGLAERRYTELSGGEQQRVQLARVLAQLTGSGALLLDEPLQNLDLGHQHHVMRVARAAAQAGVAVALVAHDLTIAARYADRIALISGGLLASVGAPSEVLTPLAIARAFEVEATVSFDPRGEATVRVGSPHLPSLRWLDPMCDARDRT